MNLSNKWNPLNWAISLFNLFNDLTLWGGKVGYVMWHPDEESSVKPDGYMVIYTEEGNKEIPFHIVNRRLARRLIEHNDRAVLLGVTSEALLNGMSPRGFRIGTTLTSKFISPYTSAEVKPEELWPDHEEKYRIVRDITQMAKIRSSVVQH